MKKETKEKIFTKLNGFLSHPVFVLCMNILGIVSFFFAFSDNIVLSVVFASIGSICLLLFVIFAIRYLFMVKKATKEIYDESVQTANSGVGKVRELLRTIIDETLYLRNSVCTDEAFSNACKNICTIIREVLFSICNIRFNVCLKRMCTDTLIDYNCFNASTKAIARCGTNYVERSANDFAEQKISDNTSFEFILNNESESGYAAPNLEKTVAKGLENGNQYKNPDPMFLNYYKSTIVVPVRIKSKYISEERKKLASDINPNSYNYIAFLCIDSSEIFESDDKIFKLAFNTLVVCGDALYPLLENKLIKEIEEV